MTTWLVAPVRTLLKQELAQSPYVVMPEAELQRKMLEQWITIPVEVLGTLKDARTDERWRICEKLRKLGVRYLLAGKTAVDRRGKNRDTFNVTLSLSLIATDTGRIDWSGEAHRSGPTRALPVGSKASALQGNAPFVRRYLAPLVKEVTSSLLAKAPGTRRPRPGRG